MAVGRQVMPVVADLHPQLSEMPERRGRQRAGSNDVGEEAALPGSLGPRSLTALPPPAARNEIHLWKIAINMPSCEAEQALSTLSDEECWRAGRFRFDHDRTRFIAARAHLRRLLAANLHCDPAELCFAYNEFGRPALAGDFVTSGLRFNLSHADELCLVAVAWERDIGVDLEVTSKPLDVMALAAQFFSPAEVAALRAVASEARQRAFYTIWTQKEAFIKAMGDGLSRPLDSFDVSPQRRALGSLETRSDPALGRGFTLLQVDPGPGFAAALAYDGDAGTLRFWTLDETPHGTVRQT